MDPLGEKLIKAIWDNDLEIVKFIVESGIDLNIPFTYLNELKNYTYLKVAAQKSQHRDSILNKYNDTSFAICKYLIDKGAIISGILREAVRYNNLKLVKYLIEKGADVNERDKYGNTPIAYVNIYSCFLYLIKYGANLYKVDEEGDSLLHRICFLYADRISDHIWAYEQLRFVDDYYKMIEYLTKKNVGTKLIGSDGKTPLQFIQEASPALNPDYFKIYEIIELLSR